MKIRQHLDGQWTPTLKAWLAARRAQRGFDVDLVLTAKVQVLADTFRHQGITAAVVGISGGIDSALVLALLRRVQLLPHSPLRQVVPLLLPCSGPESGVTGQDSALARGQEACQSQGLTPVVIDMRPITDSVEAQWAGLPVGKMTPWARGQMVANARTPVLYTATSRLAAIGGRAVVVGTTNRDEGAYLGFVGKASDGMVDIQPISDLHKSEVRALAQRLGVPVSILMVTPTGDMFDGTPDEDVFGAPYDFVEGYLLDKAERPAEVQRAERDGWDAVSRAQYEEWAEHLEALHGYNAHKYQVGSPALHLDVLESAIPGGWSPARHAPYRPASTTWVGHHVAHPIHLPAADPHDWVKPQAQWEVRPLPPSPAQEGEAAYVLAFRNTLSPVGLDVLRQALDGVAGQPAGIAGTWRAYKIGEAIHSCRTTVLSPELAEALWDQLRSRLPAFRLVDPEGKSDLDAPAGSVWRPVGINPVFRGITYAGGGQLVPHYDAPYIENPGCRSLMSVVWYLSDPQTGGWLRFLEDAQRQWPADQRSWADAPAGQPPEKAWAEWAPAAGDLVVFDHRLRHESSQLAPGQSKLLLRTDVMFERVGPQVDA